MKNKSLLILCASLIIYSTSFCFDENDYELAKQWDHHTSLSEKDLSHANTEEHNFNKGNFVKANLAKSNLAHSFFNGTNFKNINAYKTIFFRAYLAYTNFQDADLKNSTFNQTILIGANFKNADITDANFEDTDIESPWTKIKKLFYKIKNIGTKNGRKIRFSEYSNHAKINFENVTANNTNFSNLLLIEANFKNSDLSKAKFNKSVLAHADFSNVKSLKNTDFTDAILQGANFKNANLNGAIVKDVVFDGVIGLNEKQKTYLTENGAVFYYKYKSQGPINKYFQVIQPKNDQIVLDDDNNQ